MNHPLLDIDHVDDNPITCMSLEWFITTCHDEDAGKPRWNVYLLIPDADAKHGWKYTRIAHTHDLRDLCAYWLGSQVIIDGNMLCAMVIAFHDLMREAGALHRAASNN